jgi:hypothetical protein
MIINSLFFFLLQVTAKKSLMVTALHHFMDIEEDPDLIYGEEFCFPATTTYYPILHSPTGMS